MAYEQQVSVKYGDFTFPVPSPFVSRSYRNTFVGGDIWVTTVEITLTGQIAILPLRDVDVQGNQYAALKDKRNEIATEFAGALGKNFQTLIVSGHDTEFTLNGCSVTNLSFSSSNYRGLVDYTITLMGYDSTNDFVTANFGVLNPVDTWAYSDSGGTATLTHTISAQGYNTLSDYDAFSKAKAFVDSRRGTSNKIPSFLINNAHPESVLILTSKSEQVNRLGGSFGVTENYIFATNESSETAGLETAVPKMQTANILLTYTLAINEQQGGDFVSLTLSGNVAGNKLDDADEDDGSENKTSWAQVREDFKSRNFYDLANQAYENYIRRGNSAPDGKGTNNKSLNKDPISVSINPNEDARKIGFNLTFDNNDLYEKARIKRGKAYFDYTISFQHNNITDIITVQCNGTIKNRSALKKTNREAKELLDEDILKNNSAVIRAEAQELYWKMYPSRTNYVLSPRPTSQNVMQNEFNGSITYTASFSDKDFPENSELQSLGYSVQIDPATQEYKPVSSCQSNGHYLVYDLGLESKREVVSLAVNANPYSKNEKAVSEAWDETYSTSDFLKNSFLEIDEEGDDDRAVVRLNSENKVENKDTGAITYNRGFSQEKTAETIILERKIPS
tara:strand:- start:2783 stop:4642 length:1860 start_codon:yes stop_codon:yes gene_type:complete